MTLYKQLTERRAHAMEQIKRFEQGTDPDLPDDEELRRNLLNKYRYTKQALDNTLASMQAHNLAEPEDFV